MDRCRPEGAATIRELRVQQGEAMERLKNKTALIVDGAEVNRVVFRDLLQADMSIIEVDSVDAAIAALKAGQPQIDVVLTDLVFPNRSGFDLIAWLRDNRYLDELPVIVVSADYNDAFVDRAFALGATDFIRRPFAGRLLVRRVLTTMLMYEDKRDLIQQIDRRYDPVELEKDTLTGLYTKKTFLEKAGRYISENPDQRLCMVSADIGHFTLYNQLYGRDSGDRFIKYVAACLRNYVKKFGGMVGYAGADSFYYLCPNDEKLFADVQQKIRMDLRNRDLEIGFAPKMGVYPIEDRSKSILDICDRADMAQASLKQDYARLIAWYEASMEQKNNEFKLIREAEYALRSHEFTFYLQPKCNMLNGKLVGAEALVRWVQRDGKMISPGVFVPILESNGFITRIDATVWEEVCRWLRFCLDMDYPVVPISINISRNDFFNLDVPAFITGLIEQYELPLELVELEITESAYMEGDNGLQGEIDKLKNYGFRILMDDFGSGYSSLNSLKDIDIDILKMDMKFMNMDFSNMEKGVSIVETIVNMAHAMHLPIVVEGVETAEQVKFLTSINCLYAQGYYYYKPISQNAFEDLLMDENNIDPDGIRVRDVEQVNLMSLSDEKLFTDEMINNILGAIAFYEVKDGTIRLLRLNEQYYKMMGMADIMADPEYAIHLRTNILPEDRSKFYNLFIKSEKNPLRGATGDIHYIRKTGETQVIRVRVFPLKRSGDAMLYYAQLEDITDLEQD